MTGPDLPDQPVPDKVLEELIAAFADNSPDPSADPPTYDFDDPSIDRMLGIDTAGLTAGNGTPPTADLAEIDRLLDETIDPPTAPAPAPVAEPAPTPPVARTVVDLTNVDEVGETPADRSPMPTGSTKREARAAARADAKAVKAATKEAERSAKASRKQAEEDAKVMAKAARAAAKRGEAPPPVALPVAPIAGASIDPLTPKPAPTPVVARERVPVGAGAPTGGGRRTIVIADDDQPGDALYLDEDAEQRLREIHAPSTSAGGSRSTIVIDGTDQRVDALPAQQAAPNIDPRLRARRQAVHKAASRRRLLWAAVAAGIVLVVVAIVATLASPLFDVRTIDVQGNQYTDQALIEQVRNDLRGEPVLLVDTQKIERQLEANPWVESARVSTDFPHHVLVDIRERKPVATYVGSDGMYRVIDRNGRVLTVLGGRPIDYVLLTGSAPDSEPGQFAGAAFAAGAQLALALPDEIRTITTSIGVDATTNELSLELDAPEAKGVHVRLGTVSGIEDKLARLVMVVRGGLKPDQQVDVATNEVGS
ncbi:MAG: FtsQ-type POTRA domain-containing protein [Ilumatobacteraceae bacterium]